MKNSEETLGAFEVFISGYFKKGEVAGPTELRRLFNDHTDAVSYECQKHILTGLREHAEMHREGTKFSTDGGAWAHEVEYIDQCLSDLDAQLNPQTATQEDIINAFKRVFGEDVHVTATGPVGTQEDMRDRAPQFNKFADNFRATHIHLKSQGLYKKLYDASEEQTMEHVVVYCNAAGETFTRPAKEFYDIERFQELLS